MNIGTGNGTIVSPRRGLVKLSIAQSLGQYVHIQLANVRYTPTSLLNMILEDLLEKKGIYWREELNKFIHLSSGREFASISS